MPGFESGQEVGIPCEKAQGAFPGESLVSFETVDGPLSGFVNTEELIVFQDQTFLPGVVKEVTRESVAVWVKGSFFTTTGLAYLAADWAKSNLYRSTSA